MRVEPGVAVGLAAAIPERGAAAVGVAGLGVAEAGSAAAAVGR